MEHPLPLEFEIPCDSFPLFRRVITQGLCNSKIMCPVGGKSRDYCRGAHNRIAMYIIHSCRDLYIFIGLYTFIVDSSLNATNKAASNDLPVSQYMYVCILEMDNLVAFLLAASH